MKYRESDIDFSKLSHTLFEELCFDLVSRSGFESVTWRQGSADSGRDIEAKYRVRGLLVEPFYEKWFFECKNWKTGLPEQEISTKLDWAEAEKADHLILLIASHLTRDCRDYLDKRRERLSFKVHVMEKKKLKETILKYPDLVERYFANRAQRVLRNAYLDWLAADVIPGAGQLRLFLKEIEIPTMNITEIVFILTSIGMSESGLECIKASEKNLAIKELCLLYQNLLDHAQISSLHDSKVLLNCAESGTMRAGRLDSDEVHLDTCARPMSADRSSTIYMGSDVWLRINGRDWVRAVLAHDGNREEILELVQRVDSGQLPDIFPHLPDDFFTENAGLPGKGALVSKVFTYEFLKRELVNKSL